MKLIFASLCAFSFLISAPVAIADDREDLETLGINFAMGFWHKSPEEVLATVHPDISKKGIQPNFFGSGASVMESLPPDRLQVMGRVYNFDDRLQTVEGPRVNIHEIEGNFASIEMVNGEWYDFFHAVKVNGEWSLLNCVYGGLHTYESRQPDEDQTAITAVLNAYIRGLAGDKNALAEALHVNLERREFAQSHTGQTFISPLAREQLIADAGSFNVTSSEATSTIHNFTNQVAAARIELGAWTEQVQLLKIDGKWSIVNSFVM